MVITPARYVRIATVALAAGIAINFEMAIRSAGQIPFIVSLFFIVVLYGSLHVVALSIAAVLARIFSIRVRSAPYLSLSLIGFLGSIVLLSPGKPQGVHLFIIFWGSLVLIALDYFWRVNRRHKNEELAST
jgi:hypothetical protein